MQKTRRKIIQEMLTQRHMMPSTIAKELMKYDESNNYTPEEIVEELKHVKKSLEESQNELQVLPPECPECEYNKFENLMNIPSQCPECRNKRIEEPIFRII